MKRYVLTRVADFLFAMEADLVLEILEMPWLSRWPGSPEAVLGMVDYRGNPSPVLDLSKRMGGPASRPQLSSQLLFFRSANGAAALLVDDSSDLVELEERAHHPFQPGSHPGLLDRAAPFVKELVTVGDQVALILDATRLIDFRLDPPADPESSPSFAHFTPEQREILGERARTLAHKPEDATARRTLNVVVLRLGLERFALDVTAVAELIRSAPVTPLPGGPSHLLGLIYHRGGLMRLVDIRQQLGLPVPGPELAEVVVLNGEGMLTGIGVDAIESVVSLAPDDFQPHSSGDGNLPSLGSLSFQGSWLTLLDLERLQVRDS